MKRKWPCTDDYPVFTICKETLQASVFFKVEEGSKKLLRNKWTD